MSDNFKILELCESYGGGVKRQVDYLNNYSNSKEFSLITMVSSKRKSDIPDNYLVNDYMSLFSKKPASLFKAAGKVHKLVKNEDIDLIHAHSTLAGITAVFYKILYGSRIPIVYTPHAYYSEVSRGILKNKIIVIVEKIMNKFFSAIIHVSKEEEKYALNNGIVKKNKSTVINNGVPIKRHKDWELQSLQNEITFVNVARCSFQKNPYLFINIAVTVVNQLNNTKFVWVGDGPLLNNCRELVKEKNMENEIKFVGQTNDPYSFLYKSDFFMSTSRYEGQPFSVLEAISIGLPLIITDVIGHSELINKNGVLLTSNDIRNENNLMTKIRKSINYKKKFSKKSYDLFSKKYKVDEMVKNIEIVYKQNINGNWSEQHK